MNNTIHLNYLNLAYKLATQSFCHGNHPFGALIVYNDKILASSENLVITHNDVTLHAELNVIQEIQKKYSQKILEESVLYSSTEPCMMCFGAIYWANISHVVFGCSNKTLSQIVGGSLQVSIKELALYGQKKIKMTGPVNEKKFSQVHKDFW